jgi:hypothetical protein
VVVTLPSLVDAARERRPVRFERDEVGLAALRAGLGIAPAFAGSPDTFGNASGAAVRGNPAAAAPSEG